jgi:large subunit ribosomal protein L29
MKSKEIRDLSSDEQEQKLTSLKEELFNLRFQHGIGQIENPTKLKQTKTDIARVMTIIRETENQNQE